DRTVNVREAVAGLLQALGTDVAAINGTRPLFAEKLGQPLSYANAVYITEVLNQDILMPRGMIVFFTSRTVSDASQRRDAYRMACGVIEQKRSLQIRYGATRMDTPVFLVRERKKNAQYGATFLPGKIIVSTEELGRHLSKMVAYDGRLRNDEAEFKRQMVERARDGSLLPDLPGMPSEVTIDRVIAARSGVSPAWVGNFMRLFCERIRPSLADKAKQRALYEIFFESCATHEGAHLFLRCLLDYPTDFLAYAAEHSTTMIDTIELLERHGAEDENVADTTLNDWKQYVLADDGALRRELDNTLDMGARLHLLTKMDEVAAFLVSCTNDPTWLDTIDDSLGLCLSTADVGAEEGHTSGHQAAAEFILTYLRERMHAPAGMTNDEVMACVYGYPDRIKAWMKELLAREFKLARDLTITLSGDGKERILYDAAQASRAIPAGRVEPAAAPVTSSVAVIRDVVPVLPREFDILTHVKTQSELGAKFKKGELTWAEFRKYMADKFPAVDISDIEIPDGIANDRVIMRAIGERINNEVLIPNGWILQTTMLGEVAFGRIVAKGVTDTPEGRTVPVYMVELLRGADTFGLAVAHSSYILFNNKPGLSSEEELQISRSAYDALRADPSPLPDPRSGKQAFSRWIHTYVFGHYLPEVTASLKKETNMMEEVAHSDSSAFVERVFGRPINTERQDEKVAMCGHILREDCEFRRILDAHRGADDAKLTADTLWEAEGKLKALTRSAYPLFTFFEFMIGNLFIRIGNGRESAEYERTRTLLMRVLGKELLGQDKEPEELRREWIAYLMTKMKDVDGFSEDLKKAAQAAYDKQFISHEERIRKPSSGAIPAVRQEKLSDILRAITGDLSSEKNIARTLTASLESYAANSKKLVIAVQDSLGCQHGELAMFLGKLKGWKEEMQRRYPGKAAMLDDLIVLKPFSTMDDLSAKLGEHPGLRMDDRENNYVFVFARDNADMRAGLPGLGSAVRPVLVNEKEKFTGFYYPLVEIVALTLLKELLKLDLNSLVSADIREKEGIDFSDEFPYLIFTILPRIQAYGPDEQERRFSRVLRFIESA
ncbi:MAG: hypothetical protein PHS37_02290, partial [Candidatus Omnitrophica bacterium]|nr:hypothetical protein [Candidatus Omnitrophota bacterium]